MPSFISIIKKTSVGNIPVNLLEKYWTQTKEDLFKVLQSSPEGMSLELAKVRAQNLMPVSDATNEFKTWIEILWNQVKSPLVWILVFASLISLIVHQWTEAGVILAILFFSTMFGFFQEYRASSAVQKLLSRVQVYAKVRRAGKDLQCPHSEVVPGDIVLLSPGTLIPADGVLIESKDLFVNEALLTGESLPAEKQVGVSSENTSLGQRTNCVFMGTSVRSGTGKILVVHTGSSSQFGQVAKKLKLRPPETDFEKGLGQFGFFLTRIMFIFLILIFFANVLLSRLLLDSLLFSLALAVGISPELLPAILAVTLSRGAQDLAKKGVLIKRLNSIENLGSMDILCSDKTGTLTTGTLRFENALNLNGDPSEEIKGLAWLNANFQMGLSNPLDEAILKMPVPKNVSDLQKVDEIPYDFSRKRLTIVVNQKNTKADLLITKGAVKQVLEVCTKAQVNGEIFDLTSRIHQEIDEKIKKWGVEGIRVLGVATREMGAQELYSIKDEIDFTFKGFLLFSDEIHEDARHALIHLQKLGVKLKIITGDNRYVSRTVAEKVGLEVKGILTGEEINQLVDEALLHKVVSTDLFVELDPSQKERIVDAYKRIGHVVGYLGDGINDAPALHVADVGLSVESAVDVAKEAADIVFIKPNLRLMALGISEGRVIFANTLKYIFTTTSANFGNMISMAFASLFLPFLPLLASQVLLNNFLSDIPALAIGSDRVDRDWKRMPHRWNISIVRKFMVSFGLVSSVFDFVTFGFLLLAFPASAESFRTGWFIESLLTELVIIFVVRTFKRFYKSRPAPWLIISSVAVASIGVYLPYSPLARWIGLVPLALGPLMGLLGIVMFYAVVSELTKMHLFKSVESIY